MNTPMSRRSALRTLAVGAATAGASLPLVAQAQASPAPAAPASTLKGNINHAVCRWCFSKVPMEDFLAEAKRLGIQGIDLLQPADFAAVQKAGLVCSIVSNPVADGPGGVKVGGITKAFNRLEYHDALLPVYEDYIKKTAEAGYKQLICFSGNRDGMSDEQGLENCVIGLKRVLPIAERHGVTLVMELLNSKVSHKDYMCDHSSWGVELSKRLASERFRLLYDIFHMQVMEGDVIATIRAHHAHFSHYHTAGVPGRAEINDSQELYYPAIARAIRDTGFKGFLAQEFIPKSPEPLASLADAIKICDV